MGRCREIKLKIGTWLQKYFLKSTKRESLYCYKVDASVQIRTHKQQGQQKWQATLFFCLSVRKKASNGSKKRRGGGRLRSLNPSSPSSEYHLGRSPPIAEGEGEGGSFEKPAFLKREERGDVWLLSQSPPQCALFCSTELLCRCD